MSVVETCGCGARVETNLYTINGNERVLSAFREKHAPCRSRPRYTVEEIEQMRHTLVQAWHARRPEGFPITPPPPEHVEQQLRTYMAAGTTPAELDTTLGVQA